MKVKESARKTKIKRGDMVTCIAGRDKGKKGKVLFVIHQRGRVIVEGLSFVTRHTRQTRDNQQGGIIQKEASMDLSKVMLYCSKCEKGVRAGRKKLEDGTMLRFCKKCGDAI